MLRISSGLLLHHCNFGSFIKCRMLIMANHRRLEWESRSRNRKCVSINSFSCATGLVTYRNCGFPPFHYQLVFSNGAWSSGEQTECFICCKHGKKELHILKEGHNYKNLILENGTEPKCFLVLVVSAFYQLNSGQTSLGIKCTAYYSITYFMIILLLFN